MSGVVMQLDGMEEAFKKLDRLALNDKQQVLMLIGAVGVRSIRKNFDVGGRPPWKPLAKYTIRMKGSNKILVDTGRLENSITFRVENNTVIWYTNVEYAPLHQYGGRVGRNEIPARPFLVLQDEDIKEIRSIIRKALMEKK